MRNSGERSNFFPEGVGGRLNSGGIRAFTVASRGDDSALVGNMVIPSVGVQEWTDFNADGHARLRDVVPEPCEWRDGYAYPPEKPGLGMDINESAARKHPYRRAYMPLIRRVDGTMHVY